MAENIGFHDSVIKEIKVINNDLLFIIEVDTHWHPGKPFAHVYLKDCIKEEYEEFFRFYNSMIKDGLSSTLSHFNIKKNKAYVAEIEFLDRPKRNVKIHCKSYDLVRIG